MTPWTVAYQVPPFMGFSRQEYWSGLPFPSPGDLPARVKIAPSAWQVGSLPLSHLGSLSVYIGVVNFIEKFHRLISGRVPYTLGRGGDF